jgi:hypothetical protein
MYEQAEERIANIDMTCTGGRFEG